VVDEVALRLRLPAEQALYGLASPRHREEYSGFNGRIPPKIGRESAGPEGLQTFFAIAITIPI
jgi:hypothetical protein